MSYQGPKYLRIKQDLINQIKNGLFAPDEMLPSENKLIEQYNVSRITVRKAMDELTMEGYIRRIQGKGTFANDVTKNVNLSLTKYPYSCSEEIKCQNMVPARVLLDKKIIPCSYEIAKRLEITQGTPILHYKRMYLANNVPACIIYSFIEKSYFPGIENLNLNENNLHELYTDHYHIDIFRGSRIIDCVPATKEQAMHLNVIEEYPLLHLQSVTKQNVNGQIIPIDTSDAYYNTKIFKLIIEGIDEIA